MIIFTKIVEVHKNGSGFAKDHTGKWRGRIFLPRTMGRRIRSSDAGVLFSGTRLEKDENLSLGQDVVIQATKKKGNNIQVTSWGFVSDFFAGTGVNGSAIKRRIKSFPRGAMATVWSEGGDQPLTESIIADRHARFQACDKGDNWYSDTPFPPS